MSAKSARKALNRNQVAIMRMAEFLLPVADVDLDVSLGYGSDDEVKLLVAQAQAKLGLEPEKDPWPGQGTLGALWNATKPQVEEAYGRVMAACLMADATYKLGSGAANKTFFAEGFAGDNGACDCSAFVCWALMMRKGPAKGLWDLWWGTDAIEADANGEQRWFRKVKPGAEAVCIFVYGAGAKIGHTGWVDGWESDMKTPRTIIDCSSSQSNKFADGIRVRPGHWLAKRSDVTYCVPSWWR